jgi:hypothetical protein
MLYDRLRMATSNFQGCKENFTGVPQDSGQGALYRLASLRLIRACPGDDSPWRQLSSVPRLAQSSLHPASGFKATKPCDKYCYTKYVPVREKAWRVRDEAFNWKLELPLQYSDGIELDQTEPLVWFSLNQIYLGLLR